MKENEMSEIDLVNHPPHYTAGGIETIDYLKAKMSPDEYIGYLRGNIIKYVSRIGIKQGEPPSKDAGKIVWYAKALEDYIKEISRE
jgi:hypothetical protein